jgi:hypothetical protein
MKKMHRHLAISILFLTLCVLSLIFYFVVGNTALYAFGGWPILQFAFVFGIGAIFSLLHIVII